MSTLPLPVVGWLAAQRVIPAHVMEASNPHGQAAVWRVTDNDGRVTYLKRHHTPRTYRQERDAWAAWTTASGSSPLTWKIGASTIRAISVG